MIKAELLKSSISPKGDHLYTFRLTYPLMIHAHLLTHRVFSRSVSSSRAIPTKTLIQQVREKSTAPVLFRKNNAGMQPLEVLGDADNNLAHNVWALGAEQAIGIAEQLHKLGVHKELANRGLYAYQHAETILTTSYLSNFFEQRIHRAQYEISELAIAMRDQVERTEPQLLAPNSLHLPFSESNKGDFGSLLKKVVINVSKTAAASYARTHVDQPFHKHVDRVHGLLHANPPHQSPFESVAVATDIDYGRSGNLAPSYIQLRSSPNHMNSLRNFVDNHVLSDSFKEWKADQNQPKV